RDLGWHTYALSRALVEFVVRAGLSAHPNVEIRQRCRAEKLVASADGATVNGVQYVDATDTRVEVDATLVVEASGRGDLTLALLQGLGVPAPDVTTIGVDIAYSTAMFDIPDPAPTGWKGVFHFPRPGSSRGALLLPLEGQRWILTIAGRHGD